MKPPASKRRSPLARGSWAAFALALCACAGSPAPQAVVVPPTSPLDGGNRDRLARDEEALLGALALGDARLARRFEMAPSKGAVSESALKSILAEDPGTQIVDGRIDAFSFAARERLLDEAEARIATWKYPLEKEGALERDLLKRLVEEERARVNEERDLPRSASELVRGALVTWAAPEGEVSLRARDAWLAKRMDEVRATLRDGGLATSELQELDDALDALERLATGYSEASAALARLRLRLDEVPPAKSVDGRWEELRARAKTHLGLDVDATRDRRALEEVEVALRREVKERRATLKEDEARREELAAEARVLAEGRCAPSGHGVRGFLPPPERAAICGALEGVHGGAAHEEALLPAMMSLHDDVVVALWALAVHAEGVTPEVAASRYRPLAFFPPEREARLLRLSAVRATVALGAGLGVVILARGGVREIPKRAERWLAFGDAPLDVIAREVP